MAAFDSDTVSGILARITAGDQAGYDELLPLLIGELHDAAERHMRNERVNHTLQPTALVNEAYGRLVNLDRMTWQDRAHFIAMASTVMRQVLLDHARAKKATKRGGGRQRVDLAGAEPAGAPTESEVDLERLESAMAKLRELSPRQERVVEMKFYGGATIEEIAEALDVSKRTVDNDWKMAKRMLRDFYEGDED